MPMRRGRTREDATRANPQYHSRIVAESMRLNEEEIPKIPRYGIRVRRVGRYASRQRRQAALAQ